jgi:hypothetical protein
MRFFKNIAAFPKNRDSDTREQLRFSFLLYIEKFYIRGRRRHRLRRVGIGFYVLQCGNKKTPRREQTRPGS